MDIEFYSVEDISEDKMKFAVIVSKHHDKWGFCRHRERNTWEIPGGEIDQTAKRELYEETGAIEFKISRSFIFKANGTYAMVYFADILEFNPIKYKFLLDKFHFKQSLNRITKDKDCKSTLEETILMNKSEIFAELIEIIKSNNAARKDAIDQQSQYILNNQSYIRQSYRYNVNCSMESSISHTLASNFTRNPKAFSFDNIEVYVNHRMNHLNGHNLKELYLKGLYVKSSDGIKDLSDSQLDFSIFDRKKHQTKFDAKRYLNALIINYI